jgi:hypothetical protein
MTNIVLNISKVQIDYIKEENRKIKKIPFFNSVSYHSIPYIL